MPWPTIWWGEPKKVSLTEKANAVFFKVVDALRQHWATTGQAPYVILLHPDDIELLTSLVNWPSPIKANKFMNIPVRQSADVVQGDCELF